MARRQEAPYGSWKSPITSDLIAAGTVRLVELWLDGEDIYWIESRPSEDGRNVIVRRAPDGEVRDITPPPYSARTGVHEYGGGAFFVSRGIVYFSNFLDQRLYRQEPARTPVPLTPELPMRYADGVLDAHRGRIICVREDHAASEREAINTLVSIALPEGGAGDVLVSGGDFYASPRLSPDGSRLAWLAWDHPNMPWDGTELWLGEVRPDGSLGERTCVAGGREESIFQPEWSPDGQLHFVSDRTGWWNLYRWHGGEAEALAPLDAEFGLPQWQFGMSTYGFASPQLIVCSYTQGGIDHLARLDAGSRELDCLESDYTSFDQVRAGEGYAVFRAGSPAQPTAIVRLDLIAGKMEVVRSSCSLEVDEGYLSAPEAIDFPTEGGLIAHGLYYRPRNRDFRGPMGELPPLVVKSHGGPTGSASSTLRLSTQFWTSRGFAVLDVNYGGSVGYGRAYRERLKRQWGIVDVDDCVNGARYLVERGEVDGRRLIITGGSAGGYTTLAALTFRDVFTAGASYYGVSDPVALARETHKFESRYLDGLIGPYPDQEDLYKARSPLHHAQQLSSPVIFFQGLEDKVVPPGQAEMMVHVLEEKGIPVAYVPFEGEQHGFRRAENVKRALDAELYFYSRVFGFELADPVEPVEIKNL